jgi:hypothetical protein
VLKKPRTSNKMLHELARAVRGIEIKRGKSLNSCPVQNDLQQLGRTIAPVLRRGHDYFTEFLAKLSIVTKPEGETLESAFQGSQSRQPPSKVLPVPNEGLQSLASLCRELQEMFRDQPIMLCQAAIARLFRVSQQTISDWIRVLKTLHVLRQNRRSRMLKQQDIISLSGTH